MDCTLTYIKDKEHRDLYERFGWTELNGVKYTSTKFNPDYAGFEPERCSPVFKPIDIYVGRRNLYKKYIKHYKQYPIHFQYSHFGFSNSGFLTSGNLKSCLGDMIKDQRWSDAHIITGILKKMIIQECEFIHIQLGE